MVWLTRQLCILSSGKEKLNQTDDLSDYVATQMLAPAQRNGQEHMAVASRRSNVSWHWPHHVRTVKAARETASLYYK